MAQKISLSVSQEDLEYVAVLVETCQVGPAVSFAAGLQRLREMPGPELQILLRDVENKKSTQAYLNRTRGQQRAGKEKRNGK